MPEGHASRHHNARRWPMVHRMEHGRWVCWGAAQQMSWGRHHRSEPLPRLDRCGGL